MEDTLGGKTLVAAFSTGTDRNNFKAISIGEAKLLGFEDTGRVVGVKVKKNSPHSIRLALWAEPENSQL